MLAKKYSIATKEFSRFYKKTRRVFTPNFIINFLPNRKSHSQFAVVISKKTMPLAVARNKTRRIVKGWIRESIAKIPEGFYIIIIVKNNILADTDLERVKTELINSLIRIR